MSMVNMSGNYTFDYNMSGVTPDITNSTAFINWTTMSWSTVFAGYDPWTAAMGSWFYVMISIAVTGAVFVKYKVIFPTAMTLLLLSAVAVASMPAVIQPVFYGMAVLGFAGVLYGMFERR